MAPDAVAADSVVPGSFVTVRGLSRSFGAVQALAGVDLEIGVGQTLGLVGHNGAGKSTLVNILVGNLGPDSGSIAIAGREVRAGGYDVREAHRLGIRCVFQELSLCPNLRVFENARVLHPALRGPGWRARSRRLIRDQLDAIFPTHRIPVDAPVGSLSLGERQMVEIARAFTETEVPVRMVILDEPTASLDADAAGQLLRFVGRAAARGVACVFISHKLDEVLAHTARLVVMRDGRIVGAGASAGLSRDRLVEMMGSMAPAGHGRTERARVDAAAPVRIEARHPEGRGRPLVVRAGEIVGLAGLDGHGQRALLHRVFAAPRRDRTVRKAGRVAFISGDRQNEGVFPLWSIALNVTVGMLRRLARLGFLSPARETEVSGRWRERLGIRAPDVATPILSLSGGNQQKVLVARAFAGAADTVLCDDPMRGVDVGTKREFYGQLRAEADAGRSFVWYTTETEELANCDRVYVFREGEIVDEIAQGDLSEARILRASFAGVEDAA